MNILKWNMYEMDVLKTYMFLFSPQDIEAFREEMERRQMTEGSPPKVLEMKDEEAASTDSSQVKSCS